MGRPQTDTEDLGHFYPHYFNSNTSKLQFDWEDIPPTPLLYSIVHKNKPIYFINEGYHTNTNLSSRYIDEKSFKWYNICSTGVLGFQTYNQCFAYLINCV